MPTRRLSEVALAILALAATGLVVGFGVSDTKQRTLASEASSWRGLVGGGHADVDVGQRELVVLRSPSMAQRVAMNGGVASERKERTWTRIALAAQRQLLSELSTRGIRPRVQFSYSRVLNGFSAPLDARAVAVLERRPEVAGVYPVRPAYPASVSSTLLGGKGVARGASSLPALRIPGYDGRGVTIALLDTGVDRAQPYLRGRVLPGIDVVGGDDDINFLPFARLSPSQPHYRLHRFQHFYLWLLYWFLYPKWNFVDDFKNLIQGRIAGHTVQRPRGVELAEFIGGKALFFGWAFVVPLFFHPWWVVLFFYATTALLLGTTLAVVFMLAHCVEEADFPARPGATERLPQSWAVHQVQTTVDFAPGNRLLNWYVGGLNFQIEHHLFPRICHVHYSRIAPIVRQVCGEFGVRYTSHANGFSALASHWRFLRRMGSSDGR